MLVEGHSKRSPCRKFDIHWDTLAKILGHAQPPGVKRIDKVLPILHRWLEEDRQAPGKQRHTAMID